MTFLDAAVVIYYVEQPSIWGSLAETRLVQLLNLDESLFATDLVRMECLVRPLRDNDSFWISCYESFFSRIEILPIDRATCERATKIRAFQSIKSLDALHLAAAIEHGCDRFLTNDQRLVGVSDIEIEILG